MQSQLPPRAPVPAVPTRSIRLRPTLARFVPLPTESGTPGYRHVFTSLETVIRLHLPDIFPGMVLDNDTVFRVTRDSDIEIDDDDEVEDLRKAIEEGVRKRRRGAAVRLQIESNAPAELVAFLVSRLDLDPTDVYRVPGLLDLNGGAHLKRYPDILGHVMKLAEAQ